MMPERRVLQVSGLMKVITGGGEKKGRRTDDDRMERWHLEKHSEGRTPLFPLVIHTVSTHTLYTECVYSVYSPDEATCGLCVSFQWS